MKRSKKRMVGLGLMKRSWSHSPQLKAVTMPAKIDNVILSYLNSFPDSWRHPHLDGEHLLDPTTLALAHRCVQPFL